LNAPPDSSGAPALQAFFTRVSRRLRGRAAMLAAAAALWTAAAIVAVGGGPGDRLTTTLVVMALSGGLAVAAGLAAGRSRTRTVAEVERRAPQCRNLLITASELSGPRVSDPRSTSGLKPEVPPYVRDRVLADAARLAGRLDLAALFPRRRAVLALAGGAVAWTAALTLVDGRIARGAPVAEPSSDRAAQIATVDVEIVPPEYTGRSARTLRNPARIDALAGSRLRVTVEADAASVTLETLGHSQPVPSSGAQTFAVSILADSDGYLALTPAAANGDRGPRRLIGLAVAADAVPRVRATAPGKDLLVASGAQIVPVAVDADDDLGLASLAVRYTKVSGSGETFTFTEGALPIDVTRTNDRAWTGRTAWRLDGLGLQPGDMVIYRGVATDRRPGAPAGESDAFVIEVAAPGALASEGFAVDDRMDKYAVSQQMVILKTERLLASRASVSAEAFREGALDIAADQRQVRAEFVFMLGGELTDAGLDPTTLHEHEEAAGEDDLAAGRLINQGRADLMRAIRTMSRAAALLVEPDVDGALPIEKEALVYLQRAFSRSRYILRTLGERERLDLSRRLTGTLAALARPSRPAAEPEASARVAALRRVLADLAALAADPAPGTQAWRARSTALAQRLLEIDPASSALRDVAAALAAESAPVDPSAGVERAALALAETIRTDLAAAPARAPDPEAAALAGALADARKAGR
jgi:hypothetical protein